MITVDTNDLDAEPDNLEIFDTTNQTIPETKSEEPQTNLLPFIIIGAVIVILLSVAILGLLVIKTKKDKNQAKMRVVD